MTKTKPPRILITNDDGVHAAGIKLLAKIASAISDDVWIVAPETEQSGVAHSLTLHQPVRIKQYGDKQYSVSGTPTDSVMFAHQVIMVDTPPDLVFSGINIGSNVGDDVTYSGTVAGAMEATLLNVPAIAFSQFFAEEKDLENGWKTAEHFAPQVIDRLLKMTWQDGVFMNVNFPACRPNQVQGIAAVPQGKRVFKVNLHERLDPKKRTYYWIGSNRNEAMTENCDVDLLSKDYVTITPLHLDLTQHAMLASMRDVFDG